jgi:hypothetical protein
MTDTRRCVGSKRFGIEAHDAPVGDFSAQPSQKDGLSRMCTVHWRQYVAGLAREAKERTAASPESEADPAPVSASELAGNTKRRRPTAGAKTAVAQESAAD